MSEVIHFTILGILFLLSGFFSGTETALFSLNKIERRRLSEKHPHATKWVMDHLDNPRRTLVTLLIGNLIVNTLSASLATILAINYFGAKGTGITLTIYTLFLILFCEIIPKILAVRLNEQLAMVSAIPLRFFSILFYPLRRMTRFVTDAILKLLIANLKEHGDEISGDELKALVKIGEEEGMLNRQERYMLQKLLELGERSVKDIMTPRIDVAGLDVEDTRPKQIEVLKKFHFTHFPVYQQTVDNIQGIISVQEFMLSPERDMNSLLKQPLFIPETKKIADLLTEFQQKNQGFAVCVDEYGGTAGIVTMEDILEEIFGEYYDEYAKVDNPIRSIGHDEFLVEAKISLADFNEYFATQLKAQDASTLGGFILERLGEVPDKGKQLETDEVILRIHDVIRQRRIRAVVVKRKS